jgi:hypothetical protein
VQSFIAKPAGYAKRNSTLDSKASYWPQILCLLPSVIVRPADGQGHDGARLVRRAPRWFIERIGRLSCRFS